MRLRQCAMKRPDTYLHFGLKALLRKSDNQSKRLICRMRSDINDYLYHNIINRSYHLEGHAALSKVEVKGKTSLQAVCLLLLVQIGGRLCAHRAQQTYMGRNQYLEIEPDDS